MKPNGWLVLLLVVLGWATITIGQSSAREKSEVGRYQLYAPAEHIGLSYLLDTETGRVWSQISYTNLVGEPSVWVPVSFDRINTQAELDAWSSKQTPKP